MLIDGKHYDIFIVYCEYAPDRRIIEGCGQTWTPGHQAQWDLHQAFYEPYWRGRTDALREEHPLEIVTFARAKEWLAANKGRLFVNGPLEDCEPLDLEATRDQYGGKLRAGEKDGVWKRQRCLVCGAFTRQWLIPDEEPTRRPQ